MPPQTTPQTTMPRKTSLRRPVLAVLLLTCGLAACAEEMSEAERAERDRQAVEAVERVNNSPPPLEEVVPDPILYPDIETHDLFGQACAYAPGTSLGTRAIAREADAYVKIDGEMLRFAADPGSRELPARTRSLYNGRQFSLQLAIDGGRADGEGADGPADAQGTGTTLLEGTIRLRDQWDRIIYQGSGVVDCGV